MIAKFCACMGGGRHRGELALLPNRAMLPLLLLAGARQGHPSQQLPSSYDLRDVGGRVMAISAVVAAALFTAQLTNF